MLPFFQRLGVDRWLPGELRRNLDHGLVDEQRGKTGGMRLHAQALSFQWDGPPPAKDPAQAASVVLRIAFAPA